MIQPRDHAVLCRQCRNWDTWNIDAVCDLCKAQEASERIQDRMDDLIEPEYPFDTRAEQAGER